MTTSDGIETKLRTIRRPHVAALFPVLIVLMLIGCSSERAPASIDGARLEPADGVYFGVNLDLDHDSADAFNERIGHQAAVYVQFVRFPLDDAGATLLDSFIEEVEAQNGMGMLTLEPHDGLQRITSESAIQFAERAATYNERGVPLFVRFAHEMNGSWYPWSQDPERYVRAFRLLATEIHERAPETAMMWAPNYGGGYPFSGGTYEAEPGSPQLEALDTNGDGSLSMSDDPYLPYYPGDDAVDWVGMSVYHWGNRYPWGENEAPEPAKFANIITGAYAGLNGDERSVPDFYQVYAVGHDKPMAITETSALYNTLSGGESELVIKQGWWRQVFASGVSDEFPRLKMINWFEWRKNESEIGGATIDWRLTSSQEMTRAFTSELPPWLVFAD